MTDFTRRMLLVGVMLLLLAGAAVWSVNWMGQQRRVAQLAAEDLAACQRLAAEIEAMRKEPAVASTEDMGVQVLGERIEAASRQAQFDRPALHGVFPQAARPMGDSNYLEKPTALSLRGVTLEQLVRFCFHLTADGQLRVRDLRLRTPHGNVSDDRWDAEATITYLLYAPSAAGRRDS